MVVVLGIVVLVSTAPAIDPSPSLPASVTTPDMTTAMMNTGTHPPAHASDQFASIYLPSVANR